MKRLFVLLVVVALTACSSVPSEKAIQIAVALTQTAAPTQTPVLVTVTPVPTNTPLPTVQATVTQTALPPTSTPTPMPSATATPIPTRTRTPTSTAAPKLPPTRAANATPVNFGMSGSQSTPRFQLSAGLAVFRVHYYGRQGWLCVNLRTGLGKTIGSLLCPLSQYQISGTEQNEAINIPQSGEYFLEVDESGNNTWDVIVLQSGFEVAPGSAPYIFAKRGRQVTPLFKLRAGQATFHMVNVGTTGNFIIELLDANGRLADVLANEIGHVELTETSTIRYAGYYLLNVIADWDWRVEVKQP